MKFVLVSEKYNSDFFDAVSVEEAERYVEETYTEEDGPMQLYSLEAITEWN